MKTKQIIGTLMICIVLACTILGVSGVWGLIEGDTAWQCFWTLVVVAIGLGTSSGMIDVFFKETSVLFPAKKDEEKNTMKKLSLALLIMFGVSANAQEPPQPSPDPVPNAQVVEGPISDMIEKRIQARLEQRQEELYGGLMSELAEMRKERIEARQERQGLLDSLKELRAERNGIIARFTEMKDNFATWRLENQKIRSEIGGLVGRWTPLQNLVDRLTGLVWKLVYFVIAVCFLVFLLFVVVAIAWRKINKLPATIADAVVQN